MVGVIFPLFASKKQRKGLERAFWVECLANQWVCAGREGLIHLKLLSAHGNDKG